MDKEILNLAYKQIVNEGNEKNITGFSDLDECFLKSIESGNIIIIGGRPAMGKTAFMLSIMDNILKQNKKCLYISLGMSSGSLIKRMICQISEIEIQNIDINKNGEKIAENLNMMATYDLLIYDESSMFNNIKESIEKSGAEFVFIDYIQLIDIKTKRPRSEAITSIMQDLKKIAKDTKSILFIASSLSRALESRLDKRPMLCDLRDCGSIEDISDIVMFIYRDEYYNAANIENKEKAEIIVAKNKFGPIGTIDLLFKSNITKFYNPVKTNAF